jgi:hypothetical protein
MLICSKRWSIVIIPNPLKLQLFKIISTFIHLLPYTKPLSRSRVQHILSRLEFCHTPKHGSWLNMAEIELSVLTRQCLARRIPDFSTLKTEVEAWQKQRNQEKTWIDWRFTTADARVKLHRLYSSINN